MSIWWTTGPLWALALFSFLRAAYSYGRLTATREIMATLNNERRAEAASLARCEANLDVLQRSVNKQIHL